MYIIVNPKSCEALLCKKQKVHNKGRLFFRKYKRDSRFFVPLQAINQLANRARHYSYLPATHPPSSPRPLVHGRSSRTPAPQGRGIPSAA